MPEVTVYIPLHRSPRDTPRGLGEDLTLWDADIPVDIPLDIVAWVTIDREDGTATTTDIKVNGVPVPLDAFTAIFGAETVAMVQSSAEEHHSERCTAWGYERLCECA